MTALWREWTDDRPFKFEKYKSSKELELGLLERFPLGSDAEIALKILQESGGKCEVFDHIGDNTEKHEYEYIIYCEYNSGWVSWHPLEHYRLHLYGNKHRKVIEFWAERTEGFVI
jgi:hypothetical protein